MQMAANSLRRRLIMSGGIVLAGLTALQAAYFSKASATPPPAGMNDRVSIELRGRVMPRCELMGVEADTDAFDSEFSRSELRRSWEINCNTPFVVGLVSANGGLQLGGGPAVLPYEVNLTIRTDSDRTIAINCTPADFGPGAVGCSASSENDTAIGKEVVLIVQWDVSADTLSGTYSDDLSLRLSMHE